MFDLEQASNNLLSSDNIATGVKSRNEKARNFHMNINHNLNTITEGLLYYTRQYRIFNNAITAVLKYSIYYQKKKI